MIDIADLAETIIDDLSQVQGEADEAPFHPPEDLFDAGEPEQMTEIPPDLLRFWAHNAVPGKKNFQPTGGGAGAGGPADEAPAGGGGEVKDTDLSVRGERLTRAESSAAGLPWKDAPTDKWGKEKHETDYRAVIHKPTKQIVGYLHPLYERIMSGSYQVGSRRAGTQAYDAKGKRIGFGNTNDAGAKYSLAQHLSTVGFSEDLLAFWAHNAIQGKKGFQPTTGGDLRTNGARLSASAASAVGLPVSQREEREGMTEHRAVHQQGETVGYIHHDYDYKHVTGPEKVALGKDGYTAYNTHGLKLGSTSSDGSARSLIADHINAQPAIRRAARLDAALREARGTPAVGAPLQRTALKPMGWSDPEAFAEHTGAMIALMLPDAVASRLALPGGEASGDLHLTLAYLSADAANEDPENVLAWRQVLDELVRSDAVVLLGRISGVGRFNPTAAEGEPVVYASADIPGLTALRVRLVEMLSDAGIDLPSDHDFTPHITLAYGDVPLPEVPTLDLRFDRITLVVGAESTDYLLPDSVVASEDPQQFWANNAVKGKKGFQPTNRGEGGSGPEGAAADTMEMYASGGVWSPDREAFTHDPILREIREKGAIVEPGEEAPGKPPVVESPTLYMTGGGYGSGKSTLLGNPELIGFPKKGKASKVDPDAIKGKIDEFKEGVARGDKGAASFVHEESSYLAKRATAISLQSGHHTIYDTSGDSDISKLDAKVKELRAMAPGGHAKVYADYATPGSFQEAIRRVDARAARAGAARRDIPPAAVIANHAAVSRAWVGAAAAGTFDRLRLWSTAGPFGSKPKLIAIASGGKVQVRDRVAYDTFVAMGHPTSMTSTWLK